MKLIFSNEKKFMNSENVAVYAESLKSDNSRVQRQEWVDTAKGIAIIIVVLVHIMNTQTLAHSLLQTFIMPWFFALSGLFVVKKINSENFVEHFKKRFVKIMVPYFIFGICIYVPYNWLYFHFIIPDAQVSLPQRILAHIIGLHEDWGYEWRGELWFLPTLFVADIIIWSIWKYCYKIRYVTVLFLVIIALVYNYIWHMSLPWRIQTAMIAILYIVVGVNYRNIRNKYSIFLLMASFLILWVLNDFQATAMVNDNYDIAIFSIPMSVCITLLVTEICHRIKPITFISNLGKASLAIYVIHLVFTPIITVIAIKSNLRNNLLLELSIEIPLAILIAWISSRIGFFINKIAPWAFGIFPKHEASTNAAYKKNTENYASASEK